MAVTFTERFHNELARRKMLGNYDNGKAFDS